MRGADSKNNSFLLFGPLCARLTMPTASSLTPRARLGVAFFFFFFWLKVTLRSKRQKRSSLALPDALRPFLGPARKRWWGVRRGGPRADAFTSARAVASGEGAPPGTAPGDSFTAGSALRRSHA